MKIKRIVHATDFSRASRPALALALDLARAFEAELILCHAYQAVTPMGAGEASVSPQLLQQMWTAAEQGARRNLARLERSTQGSRVRTKTLLVDAPSGMHAQDARDGIETPVLRGGPIPSVADAVEHGDQSGFGLAAVKEDSADVALESQQFQLALRRTVLATHLQRRAMVRDLRLNSDAACLSHRPSLVTLTRIN